MAESIIAGLLRGKLVEAARIVGSEPRADRRAELTAQYGVRMVASNLEAARDADVILLSVKPQTLTKVGHELGGHLRPDQLVVSIVAGANCRVLTNLLDHHEVVRSMPNTPAQIGRGVTVWYATPEVTPLQTDQARVLLRALGTDLQVEDERFVEMATAVSGTGPAYVFLLVEAMAAAGAKLGLSPEMAMQLARATVTGSGELLRQSSEPASQLRVNVTSPGGTTAAALSVLMADDGIQPVFDKALAAATRRSKELAG